MWSSVIGQVRQSPASIREHFVVFGINQVAELLKCGKHKLEVRLRLSTAEVRQSPCRIAEHGQLCIIRAELQKGLQGVAVQYLFKGKNKICSLCSLCLLCTSVVTMSRHWCESPAMLPRAHTTCSRTSSFSERRSCTKIGTAPLSITTLVCSLVPEAMFVKAHAASNCWWCDFKR